MILEQAAALKDAVPIILHHHERYSGHGYPFGLRGNDIPLGARIVAIADAYDAMTHDRPYKRAMSHDDGDQGAAPPRRDAVRPGARRRCSATCSRTARRRPTRRPRDDRAGRARRRAARRPTRPTPVAADAATRAAGRRSRPATGSAAG